MGVAMQRNTLLILLLGLTAIFSVASLFMAGVISFDGSSDETEVAALDLGDGFDPNASHVRIEPFNLSIIQNNKVLGMMYVALDLETGDRSLNFGVVKHRPKLRDAYLSTLTRYGSTQMDPSKPVNVMLVKRLLQRATDNVLGESSAKVVISAVHITKPRR